MKKFLQTLVLAALFMPFVAQAQVSVEIGLVGSSTSSYVPAHDYYNYNFTQQIYTADEIGMAGNITSIAFKNTGAEKTRSVNVYMLLTEKDAFDGITDWVALSNSDRVFAGSVTFTVGEWTTLELDTPFSYDGVSNLLVAVADTTGSWSSSPHATFLTFAATAQAIYAYRDNPGAFDIANPGVTGTVFNAKNQIVLEIVPTGVATCTRPAFLTVSNVTTSQAAFTWNNTGASLYQVEYKLATDSVWTAMTPQADTVLVLTGLQHSSMYNARVKAICSEGLESGYRTANFATDCEIVYVDATNPFAEGFENATFPPTCWTIEHTAGSATSSLWRSNTSTIHTGVAGAELPDQQTGNKNNLVTPPLNIPTANDYRVSFWIYRNTSYSTKPNEGVKVWVNTTPDTVEGTPLMHIRRSISQGEITEETAGWYRYFANIPTSGNVYVIFEGISEYGTSTFIDDIVIDAVPVCDDAVELSEEITACDSYTWGANGTTYTQSGNYEYTVVAANGCDSVFASLDLTVNYSTSTSLTGIGEGSYTWEQNGETYTESGIYYDTLEAVNGCDSVIVLNLTVTPICDPIAIPYTEEFNNIDCWAMVNTASNTGLNNGAFRFAYNTNPPQYLISPELSGTGNGLTVSFLYKIQSTNYPESFQLGYSTTTNDVDAFTWGTEQTGLLNTTYQEYSEILPAGTKFVAIKYTAYDMYYLIIDSMVFDMPPACMPISGLTVSDVTANSATISWTGDAASYNVYNGETLVANVTTNTYTFTGLDAVTAYTFGVEAVCSADAIASMVTVSATTECLGGSCDVTIVMADTYGDGWNGNAIDVMQNGATVATATIATGNADTAVVSVCANTPISFVWVLGSWANETSFEVVNSNDSTIFAATGSNLSDGQNFLNIEDCGGLPIIDTVYLEETACGEYYWNGETYNESGVYTYEDYAFVYVLDLTLNTPDTVVEDVTAMGSYTWNDEVLTQSGQYMYAVEGENGCYDYYILNLTIVADTTIVDNCDPIVVTAAAAYNEGFEAGELNACWTNEGAATWHVGTGDYSTSTGAHSGDYNVMVTHTTTGNVTTLISPAFNLTALTNPRLSFWFINRQWVSDIDALRVYYRTSSTDTAWTMVAEYTEAHGEWTKATLTLPATAYQVAFEMTDLYGYGVSIDDIFIGESPDCPQVIYVTDSVSACGSYEWNGHTYYNSGDYTTVYTGANDCDSLSYTLSLTINNNTYSSVSVQAEGSYEWNGTVYTVSGEYTDTLVSSNGCDSIVTLNLFVTPVCSGTTCNITIAGNDSYGDGWNGGYISVMQAGTAIATFMLSSGSSYTETISVCGDYPVEFAWHNGSWDSEVSFTIYNGNMASVFTCTNGSTLIDSTGNATFFSMNNVCDGIVGIVTINATSSDATLGTVYGGGIYTPGDSVLIVAVPAVGSQFNGWNIAGSNPLTFVATGDMNIVANFSAGGAVMYDTITIVETDTVTLTVPEYITDTVTITVPEYITDTVTITVPEYITDTVTITVPEYITDTVTITVPEYITDTVTVTETEYITDTVTVVETVVDTLYITEYIHDTIIIHDTIYVDPQGIDGIDALNAKVYVSDGQIVVEGAEGNNVVLFDVSGRVLASKRDDYGVLRFEAPVSGSYLIRIGNHPARRIVVIK